MKAVINPDYQLLKPLVEDVEKHFQASCKVLHNERNKIKVVNFNNEDYVIKAFKVPNIINRIAYRYFRASKAKRSYEYSLKVGAELCPEAIAYIEETHFLLLSKSYYISKCFNYDFEIRPVLKDKNFDNRTKILEEFADFTYLLHEKNILHRDYSPGNILIKKVETAYQFKIVDVNRMQFKKLTQQDRLTNFARLMVDDETMEIILRQYAKCLKKPADEIVRLANQYRDQFAEKRAFKNKLRGR